MIAPRDDIVHTPLAEHGGRRAIDHGSPAAVAYDFSVCLNAFGPSEVVARAVVEAAMDASLGEYPDPASRAPRAAAARRWDCRQDQIAFGAGAAELIHAVCFAYIRQGDPVLIAAPAFGEYARAAALCGARTTHVRIGTRPSDAGEFTVEIERLRPRLVFLASPINPTGVTLPVESLHTIAAACMASDALLILDQAYDAFCDESFDGPALAGHSHVVHLRSLTKEHALAGVRAGFAVAPAPVVDAIERARVPWSASTIAQAAAIAALSRDAAEHVARTTAMLRAERERISGACAAHEIDVHPSSTHFCIVRIGDGAIARAHLRTNHGILVRDCASFGLPEWIRIAARTPAENDRLISALTSYAAFATSQ